MVYETMEMKKERIAEALQLFREGFDEAARREIYVLFSGYLTEVSRMAAGYKTRYEKIEPVNDRFGDAKQLKIFNVRLGELLQKYSAEDEKPTEGFLKPFYDILETELAKIPAFITLREDLKLHPLSLTSNPGVSLRAIPENTQYLTKRIQQRFLNTIARLRKRPPLRVRMQRRRHFPLRGIILTNLSVVLVEELTVIFAGVLKAKSNYLQALWDFDISFDEQLQKYFLSNNLNVRPDILQTSKMISFVEELQEKISHDRIELKKRIEEAFDHAFKCIAEDLSKVDTPVLPKLRFRNKLIEKKRTMVTKKFFLNQIRWDNLYGTLFNDWAVDVEVVLLYYSVLQSYYELQERLNSSINSKLNLYFDALNGFLKEVGRQLSDESFSAKAFLNAAENERNSLKTEFVDKMLAEVVQNLTGSFSDEIEKFKTKTAQFVEKVSDRRGFNKSRNYNKPISESEISYISPRELLNFEALPGFEGAVQDVKDAVEQLLEKARIKILAAGSVADFALESAILVFDQKKSAVKTAEKIALEGIERAMHQIQEAASLINEVRSKPLHDLQSAIHTFHSDIQKLKNTDNLFDLNLRIARLKAIERSKNLRDEFVVWLRKISPRTKLLLRKQLRIATGTITEIKDKIGMSAPQKQISFEISVFIKQTEASLKKLPFVYQRLYQLQPTNEDRFFVNRVQEYQQLSIAFDDWSNDRFVSCAIIGEKGSGTTSFINYFLRKRQTGLTVKRSIPDCKIHTGQQYLQYFANLFEVEKFDSNDEIINHINDFDGRLMIIIENLHHFYLKKVNGFDCQRMLFDLMANTARKAFWIGSFTIHSWEFLDNTILISDHFLVEVQLRKLSGSDLQEIIYKRNELSGYKIYFESPAVLLNQRSFAKLSTKAQQLQLEKKFFDQLALVSNGNVSLALLYWLRSTNSITEDSIMIGVPYELDLSFVKDLKTNYLFALYMLLIHDGLTLEDYSGIFNLPVTTARNTLVPMLEKGLLIRPKSKFNINPIIFRQVTNLLRSRNFIN